jgi:hypothetical protein
MNESLIVEMWDLFKDYTDKKHHAVIAEKYVVILSDHGASDRDLEHVLGHDDALDYAIKDLLDINPYEEEDNYNDFDDE